MKEDENFFLETKYNASIEVAFKEIFNTSHDCFNSSSTSSVLLLTVHSNNSRSKDRDGVFGIRNGMEFFEMVYFLFNRRRNICKLEISFSQYSQQSCFHLV